jgi:hypothetical protein
MKKLLWAIALFCVTSVAHADFDLTKLKNYSLELERNLPALPPFMACYKKDDRELCYIATNHGSDASSPTFKLIKKVMDEFRPDFVVLEGFESNMGLSPKDVTEIHEKFCKTNGAKCEEPLYAISLAKEKGIPFIGAEPDDAEVYDNFRSEGYSRNETFSLYFALLVPQFYRAGQIATMADVHKKFDQYYKMSGVSGVTLTFPEYEEWLKRNIDKTLEFSDMVNPLFVAPLSNGSKIQQMSNKLEWIRDRHILRTILDYFRQYKRVLVVYGHSHFLTQIDVLEQHLGKPSYGQRYAK